MAWKTITADDVLSEFTPQEQAMLQGIQGASEQLPGIVARVIRAARGAIRAGGYALGDEGTAPDQLEADIIAIARWQWLLAFPQLQRLQTSERQAAHDQGRTRLDAVGRQQWSVEPPVPGANPASGNWNSENQLLGRTHPVPPPAAQYPSGNLNRPYANPGALGAGAAKNEKEEGRRAEFPGD
jgi:hypothetical protein